MFLQKPRTTYTELQKDLELAGTAPTYTHCARLIY